MAKTIKNIIRDEETKELIIQILQKADTPADFSAEEGFSDEELDLVEEIGLQELSNSNKFHPVPEEFWGYEVIAEERVCDLLSVNAVIKKIPKDKVTLNPSVLFKN